MPTPTDATPYLAEIIAERDGQPLEPVNHVEAEEAASLISPYPELTMVVDPEASHWQVWLPDYMTKYAWSDGITLDFRSGGYHITIDLDPS